jgi:predicted  nucleic acid-binding Zn-ribbon protein
MEEVKVTRICCVCKFEKDLTEFRKDKGQPLGRMYGCKDCCKKKFKKWYHGNPELAKQMRDSKSEYRKQYYESEKGVSVNRASWLKTNYNLSLDDYQQMLNEQNGVCAICGKTAESKSVRVKNLSVDHDHVTNSVRGLLCTPCNRALGMFEDNIDILKSAVNYLSKFKK